MLVFGQQILGALLHLLLQLVVGVPRRKYGEEVGAFIIKKPGSTITEEDVCDYCRGQTSRYKVPRYVVFVDAYSLTASGNIQKYKLRDQSAELFPEA